MKALRIFTKEQWTALAVIALCALLVLGDVFGGVEAPEEMPLEADDRPWARPDVGIAEFVHDDFGRYWVKSRIFEGQATSKLPVPPISPPQPMNDDLAAPLFRPGPTLRKLNVLESAAKYPRLTAPSVPETALPAPADLEALKTLEEPDIKPRPDRRADREREHFTVILKGTGATYAGRLLIETPKEYVIVDRRDEQRKHLPKAKVEKVLNNWMFEEWYRDATRKVLPGPEEAKARLALAKRLLELGMMPEAKAELRRAFELQPDLTEAYLILGKILLEERDLDGALAVYEEGLDGGAKATEMFFEISLVHRAQNLLEGAAHALEQSVDRSPSYVKGKVALARVYLEMGRYDEAIRTVNDFYTKFGGMISTTQEQKNDATATRGLAFLQLGDLAKARENLQTVIGTQPERAEAVNALAVIGALEGKMEGLGNEFVRAIRADQYLIDAWLNLGALLLRAGKWEEAKAVYGGAAQRDPVSAEALYGTGLARLRAGEPEGAADLESTIKMEARHAPALTVLAQLKLREGGDEEAAARFKEALSAEPAYLPAYYGAAQVFLRMAMKCQEGILLEPDETARIQLEQKAQDLRVDAETLLAVLRKGNPESAETLIALGCTYAAMGRDGEAQQAFREAVLIYEARQKPAHPVIYYGLGYVEYKYGLGPTSEDRLTTARMQFSRGAKVVPPEGDAFAKQVVADCAEVADAIENWTITSVRLNETFDREDGPDIGNEWIEADRKYGVNIELSGGRCWFTGTQKIKELGVTTVERPIPADEFYSFEATFRPSEDMEHTEYGMSIYYAKQGQERVGFHVGFDMQGKLKYHATATDRRGMEQGMELGWRPLTTQPPTTQAVTLRISKGTVKGAPVFFVWFKDPETGKWVKANAEIRARLVGKGQEWQVGFFGRAWRDQKYAFSVDNVLVLDRAKR